MPGKLQPLDEKFPIVGADGRPTLYFTRWAQQRMQDIGAAITAEEAAQITNEIIDDYALQAGTGIGIAPDGKLSSNPIISADIQELLDTIGDVHGTVLFRGASDWQALAPGTAGQFLRTNGPNADPSWATAGGGGGGGKVFDDFASFGATQSGTAFATKGSYYTPAVDVQIESLVTFINLVAGATYRARIYQVSGISTTATITNIVDNGVNFVAPAAVTGAIIDLPLSAPVSLISNTTYVLAVSRTDSTDTFILPIGANNTGTGFGKVLPGAFFGRCQIPLANPIVTSVTSGFLLAGYITVGAIGNLT